MARDSDPHRRETKQKGDAMRDCSRAQQEITPDPPVPVDWLARWRWVILAICVLGSWAVVVGLLWAVWAVGSWWVLGRVM